MKKIAIAIVSSALAVSVCTFLWGVAEQYQNWPVSVLVAGVAAVVSLIALVFITLPLHYVLVRAGKCGIGWYTLPGLLIGLVFVFALKPFGRDPTSVLMLQSLACGVLGVIGAATFWFIAIRPPR